MIDDDDNIVIPHGTEIDEDTLRWFTEGLRKNVIFISAEAFDELQAELDRPPRVIPELVELFKRRSRIQGPRGE